MKFSRGRTQAVRIFDREELNETESKLALNVRLS